MSSPTKRFTRKVFERHSNPWSAWTRLLSAPLILVPIWTRNRKHAVAIAVWLLANPVLFPKPKDDSAWATRAILGEEAWIAERPRDLAMAINVGASAFGVGGVLGAFKRKLLPTALCAVGEVALLLAYWQLMNVYSVASGSNLPWSARRSMQQDTWLPENLSPSRELPRKPG